MSDKILKLSQAQTLYEDLRERIDALPTSGDIPSVPVQDVQVAGTSVLNNGVANIPIADATTPGVMIVRSSNDGLFVDSSNRLNISSASDTLIKNGANNFRPITPYRQHQAVFYGLATAAGDSTQAASSNAVGTYTDAAKTAIKSMIGVNVDDVQVNGTSIVANGIANIPAASADNLGAVKVSVAGGVTIEPDTHYLRTARAAATQIKAGTDDFRPIVPNYQHQSVFYGLAKAAGDTTQSASSNPVGTYTADAKTAIKTMLGVTDPTVTDVIVGNTSLVHNGIAKFSTAFTISGLDEVVLNAPPSSIVKAGTSVAWGITPSVQHQAVFYGLAKASGDSTQSASNNVVGTYTDAAKTAIQAMLGLIIATTTETQAIITEYGVST